MRFEHLALNVAQPREIAAWYAKHLGLETVIAGDQPPYAHFLRDDGGQMLLELYHNPQVPCPDYRQRHHLEFHLALVSDGAGDDAQRLIAAGATMVEELSPADGSHICMLRDPWGIPLQLCQRASSLRRD